MKKLFELLFVLVLFWGSVSSWLAFVAAQLQEAGCKLVGFPPTFDLHVDILCVGLIGYVGFLALSKLIAIYRQAPLVLMEQRMGVLGIVVGMNLAVMLRLVLVIGKVFENTLNDEYLSEVALKFEELQLTGWALGGTCSALLISGSFFIVLSLLRRSQ